MKELNINYKAIGYIELPHKDQKQTPVQPVFAKNIRGRIILKEDNKSGLKDL